MDAWIDRWMDRDREMDGWMDRDSALAGWLAGSRSRAGWLAGPRWLAGWLAGRLPCWPRWLPGSLAGWLALARWLLAGSRSRAGWLLAGSRSRAGWLAGPRSRWLACWPALAGCPRSLAGWLAGWLAACWPALAAWLARWLARARSLARPLAGSRSRAGWLLAGRGAPLLSPNASPCSLPLPCGSVPLPVPQQKLLPVDLNPVVIIDQLYRVNRSTDHSLLTVENPDQRRLSRSRMLMNTITSAQPQEDRHTSHAETADQVYRDELDS